MYLGLLKKVESNHNNLRTETVEGTFKIPVVGEDFVLYGEGLKFGTRIVRTTPVQEVTQDGNVINFKTRNSTYRVYIGKEMEETNE